MMRLTLLLLVSAICLSQAQNLNNVLYSWNYLNFTWPTTESYENAVTSGSYIPANNIITGIKVWKDRFYLALPRWKTGVPATLVSVPISTADNNPSPPLEPYPSWEMQKLDDCGRAFQYVQSMEIDPQGRMWILENGRTQFLTDKARHECPARLVIVDLESNGEILLDYEFPETVVDVKSVFLNDIVLDHEDGGWAYITDSGPKYPGIVVFSLRDRKSWKVTDKSMLVDDRYVDFEIDGVKFKTVAPVDGIALSQVDASGKRTLYYTPLSSLDLYSIPTEILKSNPSNVNEHVTLVGRKTSQTDGMIIDAKGKLYFGLLNENAVNVWDTGKTPFEENNEVVMKDDAINQWPDTFAIDEDKRLWWTSNRIQNFMTDNVDKVKMNYRVFVVDIDARSYQYSGDGTYPEVPKIL